MANYTSSYTGQELDTSIKLSQTAIAATFISGTTYAIGDYVIYNGELYKCITANSSAWNTNYWSKITITEDFKETIGNINTLLDNLNGESI